jgi:16S rRNA (guanine966-N2)-methyltransferase
MRITGGVLRGRKIDCPAGIIRPAMDKMKESVFSILGDIEEHSFLDLFSGSGSIALEASSRGANPVVLVEKDKIKFNTIKKNIQIAPKPIAYKCISAELFLKRNKTQFDIVFCDPPFPYKFHKELIALCSDFSVIHEKGLVILHRPSEVFIPDTIQNLKRKDQRTFGRSVVDFFSYKA